MDGDNLAFLHNDPNPRTQLNQDLNQMRIQNQY